jgi:hypothetical protein
VACGGTFSFLEVLFRPNFLFCCEKSGGIIRLDIGNPNGYYWIRIERQLRSKRERAVVRSSVDCGWQVENGRKKILKSIQIRDLAVDS